MKELKYIVAVLFILSLSGFEHVDKSMKISGEELPEDAKNHLERYCANIKKAKYLSYHIEEEKFFEARIHCDNKVFSIQYNVDGLPIKAETPLSLKEVPEAVLLNLEYDLKQFFQSHQAKGVYEVQIHNQYKYKFIVKALKPEEPKPLFYEIYCDAFGSIRTVEMQK